MGQDDRDVFPLERLASVETRVDAHDQQFSIVHALIDTMRKEHMDARVEHREEQHRTRVELGEKVDQVVKETAGVRAEAIATRDDLRGFKRFTAGVVAAVGFALPAALFIVEQITSK